MQQIDLARFADIGAGTETNILPAATFRVRERGIVFPASSPRLTPLDPAVMDLKMPRVSLFGFPQARLHGFRLIEANGRFFHDLSLVEAADLKFPARPDLKMFECVTGSLPNIQSSSGRMHATTIAGAVFCGIHELGNFGSWLFRALPKLLLARAHAPDRPIFIHHSTGWMKRIAALACADTPLIHHDANFSYRLEDVAIVSLPTPEAYLRPELQDLFTAFLADLPRHSGTPERIYLSRRAQAANAPRVLENETELVERLAEHGVVEFVPEQHSFEYQLAVISQAKVIVCPGGSGLFGTLFARNADIIVDLEANKEWSHAHRNVLDASGRPWAMAMGAQRTEGGAPNGPMHRNWSVDVVAVMLGLDRLGALSR